MPIGYLISVLVAAAATALSLWPRPTRGPRASPSFIFESVANELPFLVAYWLVANTAVAATQGDIDSPLGWVALAIAACTLTGSVLVIGRAAQARARPRPCTDDFPRRRLASCRRSPGEAQAYHAPGPATRTNFTGAHFGQERAARPATSRYGPAGSANRLDIYRHRSRPSGSPVLIYFSSPAGS